jgi:hypothetical protein
MSIPSQIAAESFVARGLRSELGADFDLHINGGRDRDRFVQRSMPFVVLDEVDRLRLAG